MKLLKLLIILIFASCSSFTKQNFRKTSSVASDAGCFQVFKKIYQYEKTTNESLALLEAMEKRNDGIVHLDIGGEGRYDDAINLNPQGLTSTTGEAGREIPRWLEGFGHHIPLPDHSIHKLTVENAPINPQTMTEILRVIRPRSEINLSHPTDYGAGVHQKLIELLGDKVKEFKQELFENDVLLKTIIILK